MFAFWWEWLKNFCFHFHYNNNKSHTKHKTKLNDSASCKFYNPIVFDTDLDRLGPGMSTTGCKSGSNLAQCLVCVCQMDISGIYYLRHWTRWANHWWLCETACFHMVSQEIFLIVEVFNSKRFCLHLYSCNKIYMEPSIQFSPHLHYFYIKKIIKQMSLSSFGPFSVIITIRKGRSQIYS